MNNDDNRGFYIGILGVCIGAVMAAAVFLTQPQIETAVLRPDSVDFGAIETASTASANGPERAEEWNYPAIPWRTYEDGLAEAARENKPALMVLQASWCLMCRDYQKVFKSPEVEEWSDDYVFILADIDKEPSLQKRYDVDGDYIPRTFVLEPDGGLRMDARGGTDRHRYFVDPYRPRSLLKLLKEESPKR